jgi:hypothetical protein
MAYRKREDSSIRDAALAVLPKWITQNQSHIDAEEARAFLESARGYFGLPPGREKFKA